MHLARPLACLALAATLSLPAALPARAASADAPPADAALERRLDVAVAAKRKGDVDAALRGFEAVLARLDELGVGDRPRIPVWNDLALLLIQRDRVGEARRLQEKVVAATEELAGEDAAGRRASALHNLGVTLSAQGEHEAAAVRFVQEAKLWSQALGGDHPNVARALDAFPWTALIRGEHDAAARSLARARAIYAGSDQAKSPSAAWNTSLRGRLAHLQGSLEEADRLLGEARKLGRRAGHADALTLGFHAEVLRARGDEVAARRLEERIGAGATE